jgi:predicted nucleic acid-binding OB-fold protein
LRGGHVVLLEEAMSLLNQSELRKCIVIVYNEYEKDFINVLNKHAPIKSRYQRKKPLPCMNQELRRAVCRKQMLYSRVRTNCDMRFINLMRKIARWTCSSVRGSNEPSKPIRIKKMHSHLIIENFNDDIEQIKINQTCHEVDSVYNEYEKDFINVLNKHAPIKSRYQRKNHYHV